MGVPNLPGMHQATRVNLPAAESINPASPNTETELNFSEAGYSNYEPNTQLTIGHIYGGATTFVVPGGICPASGKNIRATSIVEWYDQYSGVPTDAGVYMTCPTRSSGQASQDYLFDWTGYYGAVNPGDKIAVGVYAYNSTTIQDYVYDITSNAYISHNYTRGSIPWTDASSVVILFKACPSTTTGICPQVKYSPIEFGTEYTADYCESSNGQLVAAPCYFLGGLGGHNVNKYTAYPVGVHRQGDEMYNYKNLMTEGDSSTNSLFAKTGRLRYDSEYEIMFKKS